MITTLYVHSGMPKCGTSALQVFFAKRSDLLRSEGIDYLHLADLKNAKSGGITSGNAGPLARSLLGPKHEAKIESSHVFIQELLNAITSSDCEIGLISSEFFAMVPRPNLENFKNVLNEVGVTIKYIFYLRRQDQSLISGYMQRVKRHGFVGFPDEYIKNQYKKAPLLKYYSYVSSLEKILGVENIIPLSYEDSKFHPQGITGDFIEKLSGKVPAWVKTEKVINVSPSPEELKLLLMANLYSPGSNFSDYLVQDSVTSGRSTSHTGHSLIKPSLAEEILEYFDSENAKLRQHYGISFPDAIQTNYVDLKAIDFNLDTVVSILLGLIVRMDRKINGNLDS